MCARLLLLALLFLRLDAAPPVLVIAIDAFRWDFATRDHAANILALKKEGASVKALVPAFPSTTFPNFHSMATGLFPEHHGLVAMMFYDRARGRGFAYSRDASDGSWYGGTPIWLLAESQGVKAATYFWPGTDAEIQGRRPSYWKKYDGRVSHEERIAQVLDWLRLPEGKRPGLVIVYFSDVDYSGHQHGADSAEIRAAIAKVDASTGELVRAARAIHPDINIVVLSDHGVSTVVSHIDLSSRADFRGCRAANEAPMTMLYCDDPERVRAELVKRAPEVTVWRRHETPAHLQYRSSARIGDLVVVPKSASIVQIVPPGDPDAKPVAALKGMHGYDPAKNTDMRGILIGSGPAFRHGVTALPARTVDVYLLLCRLLGLNPPSNLDADITRLRPLLR